MLTVSHRDAVVNYGKSVWPDSTLLDGKNLDFNVWELHPLKKRRWYDFCFDEVLPGRVVRKFSELVSVLKSVQLKSIVVLISLYSVEERFARNLICHLDKADMQNYIFLGDDSEFLDDIAHRGYPVINGTGFLQSIKMSGFVSSDDFAKKTSIKSYVIKACLDLGYNLWLLNGNMISLGTKLIEPSDQSADFFTADVGLVFIRSSLKSKKAWSELTMSRVQMMCTSSDFSASLKQKSFVRILTEVLASSVRARLRKLDEGIRVIELGPNTSSKFTSEGQSNVLFWAHSMASNSVQKQLEKYGFMVS